MISKWLYKSTVCVWIRILFSNQQGDESFGEKRRIKYVTMFMKAALFFDSAICMNVPKTLISDKENKNKRKP